MQRSYFLKQGEVNISMDGKGSSNDNAFIERLWLFIKYEYIYLHAIEDGIELYEGLEKRFEQENN